MPEKSIPALSFPSLLTSSHSAPWDLQIYLYRGAASVSRTKVRAEIERGSFGAPLTERLPFLVKAHEIIKSKLERGGGGAAVTVISQLLSFSLFVAWADLQPLTLTLSTARSVYLAWVESLLHRVRISKDLTHKTAYAYANRVADLIALSLDYAGRTPGPLLLRETRLRYPTRTKRVLGPQADKQRLDSAFAFGHLLTDICKGLTEESVRGPVPVSIPYGDGKATLMVKGRRLHDDPNTIASLRQREMALQSRAPLQPAESAIEKRPGLINLRIEAELLIFIAQTGMNLTQAFKLERADYRWQTDGEELIVFRVYKGRRRGEALFRCFKTYRNHLLGYLQWLDAMGLRDLDGRLFPFIYHGGKFPAKHRIQRFQAIGKLCKQARITPLSPLALRRTRINWLLRCSRDPDLSAEMASHTKETLLRIYESPHLQSAAVEIGRFHVQTDPTLTPPGPGLCAGAGHSPEALHDVAPDAPEPDCISPEGCLFCVYHRDVMNADYCWKLASHARLKVLEMTLHKPSKAQSNHPAGIVVDRINAKLTAIADSNEVRAQWVSEARDAVREGRHHPLWEGHIALLEALV